MMDILFIIILAVLLARATITKSVGDFMGCLFASFLVYAIVKAIPLLLIGGFTFPVNPDSTLHLVSGVFSLVVVGGLLLLTKYCRDTGQNVWQVLRIRNKS